MCLGARVCVCVCVHSPCGLHCPDESSHAAPQHEQLELKLDFHRVWFLTRLIPALYNSFFFSFFFFFVFVCFLQYIHSFGSHAEPCREGSSCQGGQQAAHFVWIIMPGEKMVWIPPERLCTGTRGWKRSSVTR